MKGEKGDKDDSEGSRRISWLGVEGRQEGADTAAGGASPSAVLTSTNHSSQVPKAASSCHHGRILALGNVLLLSIFSSLHTFKRKLKCIFTSAFHGGWLF